ncbi:CocE/NonD family hydrolase [Dactylosporangium sp. NPDC050588]|uniref:CocE/NonD family hydrolase n=1 Tax=Dactylosporangium sp. NPDC050588 TaxID=3157211 RepID=UPI0033D091E1
MTETAARIKEVRDGMRILWDVTITMDDGLPLAADVFLPEEPGRYPVLLSYGPYAKGLPFQVGYPTAWESLSGDHPDVAAGSSCAYQNWEVVDPEKWVPHGYAIVRVDSRGCGRSPGYIDHFSARETKDFAACVEWAADQPWSTGKVGTSGVSYFGMNQWQVAAARPRGLAAVCIWEGASDFYRDASHHGGILSTFWEHWYDKQIKVVQYGLGDRGPVNPITGLNVCGDETLSEEELAANRCDFGAVIRSHPLLDEWHGERSGVLEHIEVPLLSAGNWGGSGLHLRGNVEGFLRAGSAQKWLEMHGLEHWTTYYTDYGREIQLAFFDHFLKGVDNGWDRRPPVSLLVRSPGEVYEERVASAWPLPETAWRRLELDPDLLQFVQQSDAAPGSVEFSGGREVTFRLPATDADREITGPVSAKLFVSTDSDDADVFLTVRLFDPGGKEVTFAGAVDPNAPISMGWLRLSHRELDEAGSTPWRPILSHSRTLPVEAGEVYEVDVEVWPTCIVVPAGYTLAVTIGGRDYENPELEDAVTMSNFKNAMKGCGPFLHDDPVDRPERRDAARVRVHCGGDHRSSVLLPFQER